MSTEQATRKVLMSPELMAQWATRDERGNLLRWDWRQPDGEWWEPTITRVYTDNLVHAALTALRKRVEGLDPYDYHGTIMRIWVNRAAVLAEIDRALGE
jgi:hypothetical protein